MSKKTPVSVYMDDLTLEDAREGAAETMRSISGYICSLVHTDKRRRRRAAITRLEMESAANYKAEEGDDIPAVKWKEDGC